MQLILILFATLFLVGCGSEENLKSVKKYTTAAREIVVQKANKEKFEEIKLPNAVTYQASTFSEDSSKEAAIKKNNSAIVNPLLAYPAKSYEFAGILTEGEQTWAYLLAPDRSIHQVKEGDTIGNDYGKISKISDDHVEVIKNSGDPKKPGLEKTIILHLKD